jgi:hypothetical protein
MPLIRRQYFRGDLKKPGTSSFERFKVAKNVFKPILREKPEVEKKETWGLIRPTTFEE